MKKAPLFCTLAALASLTVPAHAAENFRMYWDFGGAAAGLPDTQRLTPDVTFTPSVNPGSEGFTSSILSINQPNTTGGINGVGVPTPVSPLGGYHAVMDARTPDSNSFLSWTINPAAYSPMTVTFSSFNFYNRRTGTGPDEWRLDVVCNGKTTTIASGAFTGNNNTSWYQHGGNISDSITATTPITFMFYGTSISGSGSPNWKVDGIDLKGTVSGTPASFLAPPVLSSSAVTTDSITVSWPAVGPATGYYLDASTSPDFLRPVATLHYAEARATGTMNGWAQAWQHITYASGTILTNGNVATSPWIDLAGAVDARFSFNARTYNGNNSRHPVLVQATTNDIDWATVGTFTATTNAFAATPASFTMMSLKEWRGETVRLRLSAPSSVNTIGVGLANFRVESIEPDFLSGFENFHTTGTDVMLSNLLPDTTYYFRAYSTNATERSAYSAPTLPVTTHSVAIPLVSLAVPQPTIKHNSAVASWNTAANATGYEIEVYLSVVRGPRLIISKIFNGNSNDRGVEIINVGDEPADLNAHAFIRGTSGNPNGYASTNNISLTGGARYLQPGESARFVNTSASMDPDLAAGSVASHTFFNSAANVVFALFERSGATPVDVGQTPANGAIRERVEGLLQGDAVYTAGNWTSTAYTGPDTMPELKTHFVFTPVQTLSTTGASATTSTIQNLKPRTDYVVRVRGTSGGSTGSWTGFVPFTTLEPPKGTVLIIR